MNRGWKKISKIDIFRLVPLQSGIALLVILFQFIFPCKMPVNAQQTTLTDLKQQFQEKLANIESRSENIQKSLFVNYKDILYSLRSKARQAGDLKALQAVVAEIERIDSVQTNQVLALHNTTPEIQAGYTLFQAQLQELDLRRAKAILTLAMEYDGVLERLQRKLTQASEVEAASKVLRERKKLPASEAVVSAQAIVENNDSEQARSTNNTRTEMAQLTFAPL